MAVTVTIEFTDAQWELIKEHYPTQYFVNPDDNLTDKLEWTELLLAKWLKQGVQVDVNSHIRLKEIESNPFGEV